MAGGGVQPGIVFGKTDDYGYNIVDNDGKPLNPNLDTYTPGTMHIHDMNATIMHQMGIDHTKLTYRYQGRDFRLTDVHGHVVKEVLK
jgi:carbonic anhydrase